jgi:hypothetical protein
MSTGKVITLLQTYYITHEYRHSYYSSPDVLHYACVQAYYGGDSGGDLVALTVVHSCLLGQLLTIALEIKSWVRPDNANKIHQPFIDLS